jgi:hydroxyethylthiazole kinase-like uncharacterized protein yjeF
MQDLDDFSHVIPTDVLSAEQMRAAESAAMAAGISGFQMMQAAGQAVFSVMMNRLPLHDIGFWVLCGSGNNGGDGFIVAELLAREGFRVRCLCSVSVEQLKGDALLAAKAYLASGFPIEPISVFAGQRGDVVVDALFGTGLSRPIEGDVLALIKQVRASKAKVFAVDIPSGFAADTGEPVGSVSTAIKADVTIAFAAKKPAHLILPAKAACGEVVMADIGIEVYVKAIASNIHENQPVLWREHMPFPRLDSHKYSRGAVLVIGGDASHTGAARLAAKAAARVSGAVTIACEREALPMYAAHLTSIMTEIAEDASDIEALLGGLRRYSVIVGPASGVNRRTRGAVLAALHVSAPLVMDADALSVFSHEEGAREILFAAIKRSGSPVVMTPHEGEFHRLFATKKDTVTMLHDKITRAKTAAEMSGAVVLLKGSDTVIATPDSRVVINENAPPYLATAGAGDVLAGIIGGLMACGMNPFDAACAGAWLHGRAGTIAGLGLMAEELPDTLPLALSELA